MVLDLDSTQVPVDGRQEQSAYNGHFEPTYARLNRDFKNANLANTLPGETFWSTNRVKIGE